jgi:hypothetical protein
MTTGFRAQLFLMLFNKYGFGDHVSDPLAFSLRVRKLLTRQKGEHYE